MRYFILTALISFSFISSALAVPAISDEGAEEAKVVAEQYLALYAPFFAMSPNSSVTQSGEIQIEKAENYYAVTLPDITVTNYKEIKGEEKALLFRLGITTMNIAPTDDPLTWKVAIALPTPFMVTDEANNVLFEVDINDQKMGGIWNTELETMARVKAEYRNIVMNMVKDEAKVKMGSIGRIYLESNSKKISDDNWESPARITMDNFAFGMVNDPKKSSLQVDNITIDGSVTGYAPTKIKELLNMMDSMEADSGEETQMLPKGYFDVLRQAMASWNSTFDMTGLTIKNRARKGVIQQPITLDKASFNLDFSTQKNNLGDQTFGFSYSGLNMDTKGEPSKEAFATTFGLNIALNNLPIDKLVQFGEQAALAAEGPGDNKKKIQGAAMMAMMALPQTLAESGTTIRIEEMKMANKHYSLGGKGYLKATTESAVGALGEANMKYTGLTKLIAFIQDALPSVEDERKRAREERWISRLEFLERLGQPDPANPDVKTINFKLTPQGQSLINDKPMQEVLAGPSTASNPEAAPPAAQ